MRPGKAVGARYSTAMRKQGLRVQAGRGRFSPGTRVPRTVAHGSSWPSHAPSPRSEPGEQTRHSRTRSRCAARPDATTPQTDTTECRAGREGAVVANISDVAQFCSAALQGDVRRRDDVIRRPVLAWPTPCIGVPAGRPQCAFPVAACPRLDDRRPGVALADTRPLAGGQVGSAWPCLLRSSLRPARAYRPQPRSGRQ